MKRYALLLAIAILLAPVAAQTDELKLRDGTTINGTIVGFEENSFRVKTTYGFAFVQKDQVVSISVTDASKASAAEKKPEPAPVASAPPVPTRIESPGAFKGKPASPAEEPLVSAPVHTQPAPSGKTATLVAVPAPAPAKRANDTTLSTAAGSPPVDTSITPSPLTAPEPIREQVIGNTYTNETYGFQMYKPPDWDVVQGARTLLPGAVTALGTEDQTTYLLIGQEPAGKSLTAQMDATERRLSNLMENFRLLGEQQLMISGIAATERNFRGSVDGHDWSGVVTFVPHKARLYTIFGMTIAESDLVQIQENVIARAISSLQFNRP